MSTRELTFRPLLGSASEVLDLLSVDDAVQHGHFRLLSGRHTDRFLAFSAIANHPQHLDRVADWLIPTVEPWRVTAVFAPCTAGVGLAATLARRLSAPLHLASLGPEGRPEGVIGAPIPTGSRVLIVNDVTTTGTAIRKLSETVTSNDCTVAGAAWFASRDLKPADHAFPTAHVTDLDLPAVAPEECQACLSGADEWQDALDLN